MDSSPRGCGARNGGLRIEAGEGATHGYEEGSLGWVADRPRAVLPDGYAISTRLSGVVRRSYRGPCPHLSTHFGKQRERAV